MRIRFFSGFYIYGFIRSGFCLFFCSYVFEIVYRLCILVFYVFFFSKGIRLRRRVIIYEFLFLVVWWITRLYFFRDIDTVRFRGA